MKKIAKIIRVLGLICGSVMLSTLAVADETGWYGGASIGQTSAKVDRGRVISQLQGSGFTTVSMNDSNRDSGNKVFAGYRVSKNFALEGGYFDLGRFGFNSITLPAGTFNGNIKIKGVNLDAIGMLSITEQLSVFGRFGLNYAQVRDSFTSTGGVVLTNLSPGINKINYKFGSGFQFAFTKALSVRAEVERYRIDDAVGNKGDIDMFSLGMIYRFGVEKTTPAPRMAITE
jgi:OOP family OmpA-OmpF porin